MRDRCRFVFKSRQQAYSDGDGIPKTLTSGLSDGIVCEIDCIECPDQHTSGLDFETQTGLIAGPETELLGKLADEGQAHAKEMSRISGAESSASWRKTRERSLVSDGSSAGEAAAHQRSGSRKDLDSD